MAGMVVLALSGAAPAAAQGPWRAEATVTARRLARLESTTSAAERAALLEALGRYGGPPESLAPVLAALAAVEAEPAPEAALLVAAARLAVRRPDPAWQALVTPLTERWPRSAAAERGPLGRALAAIGGPAAIAFLVERVEVESAARAALPWCPERAAVIDALRAAAERARPADLPPYVEALDGLADAAAGPALRALLGRDEALDRALAAALARAGDPDAIPALQERLAQVEAAAVRAALVEALGRLGAAFDAPLPAWAAGEEPELAEAALRAWARTEPDAAAPALLAALDGAPRARGAVRQLLAEREDPSLVPVAEALLAREEGGPARVLALDLLGRARDGAGIEALLGRDELLPAALAAHRFPDHPAAGRVRERLRTRAPELAALAGVRLEEGEGLAWAIGQALGPAPSAEAVERALEGAEGPAEAWLLEAARRHRLPLDRGRLRAAIEAHDEALGGAAAHLAAARLRLVPFARGGTAADRRALARALSRGLVDPRAPVRAAAASAAAEDGRPERLGALGALLDDPHPAVRLAAARALVALAPEERPAVLGRAVVEGDPRLARLLRAVGRGEAGAPADVLVVQTVEHRASPGEIWLEIQSDDGLWRRLPASPSGWLLLPEVPGPSAEVSLSL